MTKQSRREFLKGTFGGLVGTLLAWIGIPRLDETNDDDDDDGGWGVVVNGRDAITQPFGERGSSRGWEVPKRTWDAPPKYNRISIDDTHRFVDDVWVFPLDEVDLDANPWDDLSKFSLAELDAYVQWFGKGQIEVDATKYLFNPQPGHVIWYHLGNQGPGVGEPGRTLYVRRRVGDTLFCSSLKAKRAFDLAWNHHHIVWQEGDPFPVEIARVDMGSDSELEDIKCDQFTLDVDFRVEPGQSFPDRLVGKYGSEEEEL